MSKRSTPKADTSAGIIQLKAVQSDWDAHVRGRPYRVIEISAKASLQQLAVAVLESFDFDPDHMFGFYDNLKNWAVAEEKYEFLEEDLPADLAMWFMSDAESVTGTAVETAFDADKKKLLLLFDYGDEWHFIIQRIALKDAEAEAVYPRIVSSQGTPRPQYE